ncbi:MAG: winged helix-turn-helix domain-containing protein, partial [Acetobacteraceae bacterium]
MKSDNRSGRVAQHLRGLAAGQSEGARLPSVRQLMRTLGAGPVTIAAALKTLSEEGLIEARPGHGTFVAAVEPPRSGTSDLAWQTVALGPARGATEALAGLA